VSVTKQQKRHELKMPARKPVESAFAKAFASPFRVLNRGGLGLLEQTTRPLHGIAGATYAAQTGKNPTKAFVKGLQNKDKHTFSDVAKKAGLKGGVAAAVGLVGDVGLDPTTYVSGGASVPAKVAAKKEAEHIIKKGLSKEVAEASAKRIRAAAPKTAREKAIVAKLPSNPHSRELHLQVGRKKVQTGIRSKPLREKSQTVANAQHAVAEHIHPGYRPAGTPAEAIDAAKAADRQRRAAEEVGLKGIRETAQGMRKALGPEGSKKVIDALEHPKGIRRLEDKTHR
jgi:hypothetical protein